MPTLKQMLRRTDPSRHPDRQEGHSRRVHHLLRATP
jgi:hypothetical protein